MTVHVGARANILILPEGLKILPSGGAVIPMKESEFKSLAGGWKEETSCLGREIFSQEVEAFLAELTDEIRRDPVLKNMTAAVTFAFWCRKNRLNQWKEMITEASARKGRGTVFHVAPSNIPFLFAYSLVYGLLAGNGNLIRISEKISQEVAPFLELLDKVMGRYPEIYQENLIFTYGHDDSLNDYFSKHCQGRILWGGDETIYAFRKFQVQPGCLQLEFPDRYSVALFEEDYILQLDEAERTSLAQRFYNDTYEVDQNACSSPRLIFWVKGQDSEQARKVWWQSLLEIAQKKYPMDFMRANEKYALVCKAQMDLEEIQTVSSMENMIYLILLKGCHKPIDNYQGKFGIFYEYEIENSKMLLPFLDRKVQTVVYAGNSRIEEIRGMLLKGKACGGDRVVAVGDALNLGPSWDGNDMIRSLSRVIG